ncbi:unnamed protein product, partial [Medioppia subpectinata]
MFALKVALVVVSMISVAIGAGIRAAPYYMPLDNNGQDFDMAKVIEASGVKQFILAFALASDDGQCIPTWDGKINQKIADDQVVLKKVQAIRAAGGDISVSFGGYNGIDLAHVCKDVNSLANAHQIVIDKYSLTNVDFDVEHDNLGDVQGGTLRFNAIKVLQQSAKSKDKQQTLPSTTVGLSGLGRDEIKLGVDLGAKMDLAVVQVRNRCRPPNPPVLCTFCPCLMPNRKLDQ